MVAGVCLPVWKGQGSGLLFRGMLIRLLVVTRSPARKEGFMLAYSLMETVHGGRQEQETAVLVTLTTIKEQ